MLAGPARKHSAVMRFVDDPEERPVSRRSSIQRLVDSVVDNRDAAPLTRQFVGISYRIDLYVK